MGIVKLKDICTKGSSNIAIKDLVNNEGQYPIYGASGLIKKIDYYKQEKKYLGIIKDGAGVGRVMLLPEKSSVISTIQCIYNNEDKVDIKYLYYCLKAFNLGKSCVGATIPHIYFKDYGEREINLPSFEKQYKVIKELDTIEYLISKYKLQIVEFDQLIQSKYNEMFGPINLPHDSSFNIRDVAKVISGSTPKTNIPEYWDGKYKWITPAEIEKDDYIIVDTNRHLTEDGVKSCSLKLLPKGTVLFSSRAPIGKVALVGEEMYCNQGFKNLVCSNSILPTYLYVVLKYNTEYLQSLGRGATFKEVSKQIVENISIKVPKLEEQKKFVEFFNHIKHLESDIKHSIKQLETLKKAQMQKYFG